MVRGGSTFSAIMLRHIRAAPSRAPVNYGVYHTSRDYISTFRGRCNIFFANNFVTFLDGSHQDLRADATRVHHHTITRVIPSSGIPICLVCTATIGIAAMEMLRYLNMCK